MNRTVNVNKRIVLLETLWYYFPVSALTIHARIVLTQLRRSTNLKNHYTLYTVDLRRAEGAGKIWCRDQDGAGGIRIRKL